MSPLHRYLSLAGRLYLGTVFLLACWHKVLHPQAFALDIATYQIVPLWLVNLMALALPWAELSAGLMMVLGIRARSGALLAAGMMAMFLAALAIAMSKGLEMSCGCFASTGAAEDPISWKTLARDGLWLAIAAYVVSFDREPLGLEALIRRRTPAVP